MPTARAHSRHKRMPLLPVAHAVPSTAVLPAPADIVPGPPQLTCSTCRRPGSGDGKGPACRPLTSHSRASRGSSVPDIRGRIQTSEII